MKLYFRTETEMNGYNTEEAKFRGCDINSTKYWYSSDKDENGYYLLIDDSDRDWETI